MKSASQFNQDLRVIGFYNQLNSGYFVDIGAFDGVSISNSWLLESELGWKGICVEPQPVMFEALTAARSAHCVMEALSSKAGEVVEFAEGKGGNRVLSGIAKYLDGWGAKAALRGHRYTVKTNTLDNLLDTLNAPGFIHYLTLDTEGSELEILNGVNLDQNVFGYICVEHNNVEERREKMRTMLESHGYIFKGEFECDDEYVHRSLIGGIYYFNNDFDKPIEVALLDNNIIRARSTYWPDQYGLFDPLSMNIKFDRIGVRKISAVEIRKNRKDCWRKRLSDLTETTQLLNN